jgi:hypothetical protein
MNRRVMIGAFMSTTAMVLRPHTSYAAPARPGGGFMYLSMEQDGNITMCRK